MMPFDIADFFAPLDPAVLLLSLALGVIMGIVIFGSTGRALGRTHLFWATVGNVMFFVPISLFRGFGGSPVWERLLATVILFQLFLLAMNVTTRVLVKRQERGNPNG